MHARESRTSTLQAERDDRREPMPAGPAPQQPPTARGAIDILSKTETPKTRPCGIIAPERTQRVLSSPTLDLHLSNRQTWPTTDHGAYKYTVAQNNAAEYVYPQRNISPRQTFQENMRRILVPPRSDLSKLISEPTPPLMTYPFQLNQQISKNLTSESKYCEVPYIASQIPKQQRTSVVRNSELYTSNVGVPPLPGRGWPSAVPPTPPAYYPPEYYGHQQSYSTAVRPKVPVKKGTDQLQQAYNENLCRSGDVRFEPYHTAKEKYPRARYEYVNFPNSYHSYVLPPQKYDSTKPVPAPVYVNYTPQKYVDPRIVDPRIADSHPEAYVRPSQYLPGFTTQHPEYISSKFVPPSIPYHLQNKFYGHSLESGLRHTTSSTTKSSYEPSRLCYDQDYGRGKPLQTNESSYITEMPPYGLRGQVPLNNYPLNNAHPRGINHMYQYRNDSSVKSYSEPMSQYKYPDIHTSAHNPLARIPAQFSPNVISPSESNTSMESVPMQAQHEDCGYVSQCSTTSGRSIDYSHYKLQQYEHGTIDNRSYQLSSTSAMKLPHKNNTTVKHTKNIDIRQFLQTWDEDDDDDCFKAKDRFAVPLQRVESVSEIPTASTTSEPPLYVLGYVNIPSDEIGKYEHIQKVCKLPENIRGYDSADLLNKFDEAFHPNSSNTFTEQAGNNSQQVIKPINESLVSNVVGTARAPSPFDVEDKITQSVIHKDVGCNFEIKPFSPPLQSVEASLLSKNTTERKIEKIVNPNIAPPIIPNTLHHTDDKKYAVKRQSLSNDESTSNSKIMKTVNSQFSFNNSENKQEAIGKDFSTISGMCLASLPRLDNEMELNFQEINEQYSHLKENHESVIISTPNNSSLLVHEDQVTSIDKDIGGLKTIQNNISKINNDNLQLSNVDPCFYDYDNALPIPSDETHDEKNPMKLSKIRRNKLHSSVEFNTVNTPQNSPMQRTDSVIIKNPDNIEKNSPILGDFEKLPHFIKQTSSIAETKQSTQNKPSWSSGLLNQSHDVNKCSGANINQEKVTMINTIQTHFTEILPLPGSKSPINLIMHSHNEEYTNCIRPSLIHCTPNESDNINNAMKGTDYVSERASENLQVNSDHSKSDINEMPINVAINLSINSNQSDLYSVNNTQCHELKEIDKSEAGLVSLFKEKNIPSPSNQTGEPKENDKSTSGLSNSHELTLQCFNRANIYSDDSNITLCHKENSNECMTSQTSHEKSTHDVNSPQKQFNENNIVSPKTDCIEELHSSIHSQDQPDILVDGQFENDKLVNVIDTANVGNSGLLLDVSERENSCSNETINGLTFLSNSISEAFTIKSPLKVIDDDSDDQLEENIENIALHIMASGNMLNSTEKSVGSDIQPSPQSAQLQDPIDNSLHNNELCGQNQYEVNLHNNAVQIESENKIKVDDDTKKDRDGKNDEVPSEESNHNYDQVSECDYNEYQNSQFYNITDHKTHEEIAGEEKSNKLENIVIETPSCLQIVSLATDTEIGSEIEDNNHEQSSEVPDDIGHLKVNLSGQNAFTDDDYCDKFEPEFNQDINIDTAIGINTSSECKSIQEIETERKSIQEVITIIEVISENSNLSYNLINETNTVDALKNDSKVFSVTNEKFSAQENKYEGDQRCINDVTEKCYNVPDLPESKLNHDLMDDAVSVTKVNLSSDNIKLSPSKQEFKFEENYEHSNIVACKLNDGFLKDKITEDNLLVSKTTESNSEVSFVSTGSPKGKVEHFDDLNNKSEETTKSSTIISMAYESNIEYPTPTSDVKPILLEKEIQEIGCDETFENLSKGHNSEELLTSTHLEPIILMNETAAVSNVTLSQKYTTNQEIEDFVDADAAKMYHALDDQTLTTKAVNEKDMSDSMNTNLNETSENQFENNDITSELNKALPETNVECNSDFVMEHKSDDYYQLNSPKTDLDLSPKYAKNSSTYGKVDNEIISLEVVLRDDPILNEFPTDSNNDNGNKCYRELQETTSTEIMNEMPVYQENSTKNQLKQNMQHTFFNDANVHNEDIIYECDHVKDDSYVMKLTPVKVKKNIINNNTENLAIEGIFECCKDYYSISKTCESTEGIFDCVTLPDSYIESCSPKDEVVESSNQNVELNEEVHVDETISNISPVEIELAHIEYSLQNVVCSEKLIHSEEAVPKNLEDINEITKVYTELLEYEDENKFKPESVILDSNISEININSRTKCIQILDPPLLNDSTTNSDNSVYKNCNISKEIHQTRSKEINLKNIVSYKCHKKDKKLEIKESCSTPHNIQNNDDQEICDSNTMTQTFSNSFISYKYKRGIIFDTYFSNKDQNWKNFNQTSDVDDFIKSQMSLIKNKNRNTRWDKKFNADKEQYEKDSVHEKCDNLKKLDEKLQRKICNNLYIDCRLSEDSTESSIGKQETPSSDLNNTELSSHLSFIFENLSRKRRSSHNYSKDMQIICSSSNISQHIQRNNCENTTPVTKTTQNTYSRSMNKVAKLFLDDKESEKAKIIGMSSDEKKIERNIDSDTYLSKWININNESTTSLVLGQEKQIPTVIEKLSKTNNSNEQTQNVKDSEILISEEKTCSENNDKEVFIKNDYNSNNLISLTNIFEEDIKSKPMNQKHNKENDIHIIKLPMNISTGSMCSEKFGLYDELWADTEVSVHSNETKMIKGSIKQHHESYSKNLEHTLKLLPGLIEDLPLKQNINGGESHDYLVRETETALNSSNDQHIHSSPLRNEDSDKKTNDNHVTSVPEEKSCCPQISDKSYNSEYAENCENSSSSQNFQNTESNDENTGKIKIDKVILIQNELNIEAESPCACENSDMKDNELRLDMHVKEFNMHNTHNIEYGVDGDVNEGMKEDRDNENDSSEVKIFAVPIEHIVCMEPDSTQECYGQGNASVNKKIKTISLHSKQNKESQGSNETIINVTENNMCEISNICDMNSEKNIDGCSEEFDECDSSQAYEYNNEIELCKTPHSSIHSTFFDSEASFNLDDSVENQECLLIEDGCIVTDNVQIIDEYNVEINSNDHCSIQDSETNVLQLILHSPTPFDPKYKVPDSPNDYKNGETSTTDNGEEIWIDDVACIETVVSEEVEQEIDSDCPEYHSPTDVQSVQITDLGSNERINYDLSISFNSTKLKDIYGDNMDNNDIHLVETLYRTPHMDVRSKLNESECNVRRSKQNLTSDSSDENSQDCVIFGQETNKDEREINSELTHTSYSHSNMSHNKQTNENQAASSCVDDNEDQEDKDFVRKMYNDDDKSVHLNLSYNENTELIDAYFPRISKQSFTSDSSYENDDHKCSNVTREIKNKGNNNNCHSSLSHEKHKDIVHKIKKSMISGNTNSVDGNSFERIECDNFKTQTYQSHTNSHIHKNKHTDLTANIYLSADVGNSDNTKKSDNIRASKVSNSDCLSRRTDKLITKAAQKYVPPLKISAHNLKVQLPLPEENLRRLQHLKAKNQEHERSPIPKLKIITSHLHKNNANLYKKKIKPKFEDVLKHIDDTQYKLNIKQKNKKKTDRVIPKVIIKKNGSQYTSTSPAVKPNFNPDLTGSRWQPSVSLERHPLIDKMFAKRKTKVSFCSLTGKFVIQHKSYKIKDLRNAPQYSIEGVKEKPLKCTIMLN